MTFIYTTAYTVLFMSMAVCRTFVSGDFHDSHTHIYITVYMKVIYIYIYLSIYIYVVTVAVLL